MNARGCAPGTLLLASSPCPFCGTPARLLADTASSGVKGWTVCCPAENKVCPIHPRIWRQDKAEAIRIWCERMAQ